MTKPSFAPELYIPHGTMNVDFYTKAFGAELLRTFMNDDGSYHVAEFSLQGQLFHLHENSERSNCFDPVTLGGSTALVGLFVDDVDAWMKRAIVAGGEELSPAQDYDYGYRQGVVKDIFGHTWMIEKRI